MRIARHLMVILSLCPAAWSAPGSADVIGTWEGESKCAAPDSPCRDEHALYKIFADKANPAKFNVDGYKVVNGASQFMGRLACDYRASQSTLHCTGNTEKQDDWEFHVFGDTMTGTLTIGPEKTLYRRISLHKVLSKE